MIILSENCLVNGVFILLPHDGLFINSYMVYHRSANRFMEYRFDFIIEFIY